MNITRRLRPKVVAVNKRRLIAGLVTLAALALPAVALARTYVYPALPAGEAGRAEFHGYFTNAFEKCGDHVIFEGLGYKASNDTYTAPYGAPQFEAEINGHLFSATTGQDQTGAAFIVLTMMGVNGTDPRIAGSTAKGVALARSIYPQWLAIVNAYANAVPSKVDWATMESFPRPGDTNYLNTEYQGRPA